jgi:D-tyrosyl-tRNA(Tyr) deacylase
MRAIAQRVSEARVLVDGEVVGAIGRGLAVLVGVAVGDDSRDAEAIAVKLGGLRVFADEAGKMNLAVQDVGGAVLVVSQFTLLADVRKGRRPSFVAAAPPDRADRLVGEVVQRLEERGITCATGSFGAHMKLELANDGPVTIIIESEQGRIL